MKREELIPGAADVFRHHPDEQTVFATTDGNFFHEKQKASAFDHAKKQSIEVVTFTRIENDIAAALESTEEAAPVTPAEEEKIPAAEENHEADEQKEEEEIPAAEQNHEADEQKEEEVIDVPVTTRTED